MDDQRGRVELWRPVLVVVLHHLGIDHVGVVVGSLGRSPSVGTGALAERREEHTRVLAELHPQRPPGVRPELGPQGQRTAVDDVVLHGERQTQVEEEAGAHQADRPGLVAAGVTREVHQQGHQPQPHGDRGALSQHPSVAGPDAHRQAAQCAEPDRADQQRADDPGPGGGRHVPTVGVGEHGEEPEDTEDHREPGLVHPTDGHHPHLAQQDENENQHAQCVREERHRPTSLRARGA